ncbi:MAG: Rieske 2Fe-2S domain-containing protein [Nitrospina sp.]|jgi:nitrite reductase/ring-hydroxylating ferredoxin subunit|nr:Rieske 2Fe-2S domain-containing protein [Nitrospina sp.]MBT5632923.1 Rieske 2Fe-2S domain-containing protein [Nitrospina sp.]
MTNFTEVATVEEIPPGERKRVEVNNELITLFNLDGELFAIYDKCPHKKTAPLVRGTINGVGIKCPNHGYRFDLKTGKCDRGEEWDTRVYQVKIDNGKILVGPVKNTI